MVIGKILKMTRCTNIGEDIGVLVDGSMLVNPLLGLATVDDTDIERPMERVDDNTIFKRRRRTDDERSVLFSTVGNYIISKQMPPGNYILQLARKFPNRTPAQIRTQVHNFVTGKVQYPEYICTVLGSNCFR